MVGNGRQEKHKKADRLIKKYFFAKPPKHKKAPNEFSGLWMDGM
jgi:hypothetical protein